MKCAEDSPSAHETHAANKNSNLKCWRVCRFSLRPSFIFHVRHSNELVRALKSTVTTRKRANAKKRRTISVCTSFGFHCFVSFSFVFLDSRRPLTSSRTRKFRVHLVPFSHRFQQCQRESINLPFVKIEIKQSFV